MGRMLAVMLGVVFFLVTATPADATPTVAVGLVVDAAAVRVGGTGNWELTSAGNRTAGGIGGDVVMRNSGSLTIDGRVVGTGPLLLTAQTGYITVNGLSYRGTVQVTSGVGGITVVNRLPLEQYLCGVVPREMPADWPAEALNSQAIISRTFALYSQSSGKHAHQGFDICAGVCCQAYSGVSREDPRTTAAVTGTVGTIITRDAKPILAAYHSCSGGHTEHSENVWSGFVPYLRGVPDFDQDAPRYSWTQQFNLADAERLLQDAGIGVGRLYAISLASDRGVSGRAINVRLTGSAGHIVVRAITLRTALGLFSTQFNISVRQPQAGLVTSPSAPSSYVVIAGAGTTTTRRLDGLVAVGAAEIGHRMGAVQVAAWRDLPGVIVFDGQGHGHGVGLSQWGARALAEQGHDYRHILGYYYQGVDITTW